MCCPLQAVATGDNVNTIVYAINYDEGLTMSWPLEVAKSVWTNGFCFVIHSVWTYVVVFCCSADYVGICVFLLVLPLLVPFVVTRPVVFRLVLCGCGGCLQQTSDKQGNG